MTALAALLKPILAPIIVLTFRVIARCGLLAVQKLPDSRLKRLLTARV